MGGFVIDLKIYSVCVFLLIYSGHHHVNIEMLFIPKCKKPAALLFSFIAFSLHSVPIFPLFVSLSMFCGVSFIIAFTCDADMLWIKYVICFSCSIWKMYM